MFENVGTIGAISGLSCPDMLNKTNDIQHNRHTLYIFTVTLLSNKHTENASKPVDGHCVTIIKFLMKYIICSI